MKFFFRLQSLLLVASTFFIGQNITGNNNPIVIVTASYRNAHWLDKYFHSLVNQTHPFKKLIYVADNDYAPTSDGTGAGAEEFVKKNNLQDRVVVIRNQHRQLALQNLYKAILSCDDEDVIAIIDGDDELAGSTVLEKVHAMYSNPTREIWATYGNFKSLSSNQPWGWTHQIPADVVANNTMRQWLNGPTHLKTFKAWLFKQIAIKDLFFDGDFLKSAYDVAIFEPMYEMLGHRFDFTQEVLYVYNDLNPINDGKVNRQLQLTLDHFIRAKPPYKRLSSSDAGRIDQLKNAGQLKADVIVFSGHSEELDIFLENLQSTIKNVQDLVVITTDSALSQMCEDTHCRYRRTCPLNELPSMIKSLRSDYILFVQDGALIRPLDISDALIWLEKTHAHAFYCGLDKKMFDQRADMHNLPTVLISLEDETPNTTYAWQYQGSRPGLSTLMTLIRKKDLLQLSDLKNIQSLQQLNDLWNTFLNKEDVGLFHRGA